MVVMNKRVQKARLEHDKFLTRMGITSESMKAARRRRVVDIPTYKVESTTSPTSDRIPGGVVSRSAFDNRHRETPAVREQMERLAKQVAPAYNKGAYQYISANEVQYAGKKI